MFTWLFWLMLAFAVADWVATWRGWETVRWITKPGTLALLVAWFSQVGGWRGPLAWFGLALIFSLLGDVLLHLPPRFFLPGVGAFLFAHICYIVGFTRQLPMLTWLLLTFAIIVAVYFTLFIRGVWAGLRRRGENALAGPVTLYALILSLMWLAALATLQNLGWSYTPAVLVSLGAGLFAFSDSMLAYARFVRVIPNSDLYVMVTYHCGQILMALGALEQFGPFLKRP